MASSVRDRNRGRTRAALIGIPLALALGAIASRLLLPRVPQKFALDLSQPIPVVTWWAGDAFPFLAVFAATLALGYLCYLLVLRNEAPATRTTLLICAASLIAGLFWLPLFSSDVYAYAAYGEMTRVGLNPYIAHPSTNDALINAARWQWTGSLPPCVYGIGFVAVATALISLIHAMPLPVQIESFRVLACIALLLAVALFIRVSNDERSRFAVAFLALNPVVLWSAIEGHNDTIMLAVALAGIVVARRSVAAGVVIAALSGLFKAPGVLAGIGLALHKRSLRSLAALVVALFILAAGSIPLFLALTQSVAPHGHYAPYASIQSLSPILAMVVSIFVISVAWPRATTPIDRWLVIALAAWPAIPNPYPWYGVWLLPLAAWSSNRPMQATAVLVTAAALLRYVPDAVAVPSGTAAFVIGMAALLAYGPLLSRGIIGRS